MVYRLIRRFYGNIADDHLKKFLLLALAFFFTIASYWLLRPLKDGLFFHLVGGDLQPRAKQVSVGVLFILVLIYSKIVDLVKQRHTLFYIIGVFYALIFLGIGYCLHVPSLTQPWLGWFQYCAIESFGSLGSVLFWSFSLSVTNTAEAKIGFPLIVAAAQLGGITGPAITYNAHRIGVPNLFFMASVGIICMVLVINYFMRVVSKHTLRLHDETSVPKKKTGFLEGVRLLVTKPYLFSIFGIVFLYEILSTIIDYQMKVQAYMLPQYASREDFIAFLGFFGICTNIIALLVSLLGTSYFLRRFSIKTCLMLFPSVLGAILIVLYYLFAFVGVRGEPLLWFTFMTMMVIKGLSYAFNNPSKDMLYIPTSQDVKFKTKGWIDMFGNRISKATGAVATNALIGPIAVMTGLTKLMSLMSYGLVLAMILIVLWMINVQYIGRQHARLLKNKQIIQ